MQLDRPAMINHDLFEILNAGPGLGPLPLAMARFLATQLNVLVVLVLAFVWVRGARSVRRDVLEMLLGCALASVLAQLVLHFWPQPRPFMLNLGTQYLHHAPTPGLPSHHVTFLWALAFSAWSTRRLKAFALPLLVAGLVVGWSRVFLGVHFPYDVLAAAPVAWAGAFAARRVRKPAMLLYVPLLHGYARLHKRIAAGLMSPRHT
jgi:undecaprenyl-diphosphatase